MNKEDIKAWLGINIQDTLINFSAIFFLIGFFTNNLYSQLIFLGITFLLSLSGLFIYFKNKNQNISKTSELLNRWGSVIVVIIMWILIVIKLGWTFSTKFELFTNTKTSIENETNSENSQHNNNIVFSFYEINDRDNAIVTYENGYTYFRGTNIKDEILFTSTDLNQLSKNNYLSSIDYNFNNFPKPGKYSIPKESSTCYSSTSLPYEYKIYINNEEYTFIICDKSFYKFEEGTPENEINRFVEYVGNIDTHSWEKLRQKVLQVTFSANICDIKKELPENLSAYSFNSNNYLYAKSWKESGLLDLEIQSETDLKTEIICYPFNYLGKKTYSTITNIKALFPHEVEAISEEIMFY